MSAPPSTKPHSVFRLRGRVDMRERYFLIPPGQAEIGSAADNDLVLAADTVSRYHARISSFEEQLEILDLGSKNGTFVDGRRLEGPSPLQEGDTIRFGSVELRLERIDARDARLWLKLDPPPRAPAADTSATAASTAALPRTGAAPAERWLGLLGDLIEHVLAAPQNPIHSLLQHLTQGLGAGGAIVTERFAEGSTTVVGIWGNVSGHRSSRLAQHLPGETRRSEWFEVFHAEEGSGPDLPIAAAVRRRPGGSHLALQITGAFDGMAESGPLLLAVLRLVELALPEVPSIARAGAVESPLTFPTGHVVGRCPSMQQLYREIRAIAASDGPVILSGETGVGKEHVAQTIHLNSPRRAKPLIAINCAAIPADLLEAELFGVRRGVATGVEQRPGKFVDADGGTLLLDEIGEMPSALQAKLLRTLDEHRVQPLGGAPIPVDLRVLAATHVDLEQRIASGSFRPDLYYRLALHRLRVPALRERRDDLPLFIEHFLRSAVASSGRRVRGLSVGAFDLLVGYHWPGNVRQLHNEIHRLVYACAEGEIIDSSRLPDTIRENDGAKLGAPPGTSLDEQLEALERRLIRRALDESDGVLARAAERLGIHRNSLSHKMKRLGLER